MANNFFSTALIDFLMDFNSVTPNWIYTVGTPRDLIDNWPKHTCGHQKFTKGM